MFRMREEDEKGVPRFRQSVCFFLEPEEAKAALKLMQEAMPATTLTLTLHGLGSAFEHCRGWHSLQNTTLVSTASDATDDSFDFSEGPPTSPTGEPVSMRIMGNDALVNVTKESMLEMLGTHAIASDGWTLPVFVCNQLQGKTIFPVFLRPSDLKKTWVAAGRTEESIPTDIMVVDLRHIVAQMRTDANDWTRVHLVPSEEAVALAQELQKGAQSEGEA